MKKAFLIVSVAILFLSGCCKCEEKKDEPVKEVPKMGKFSKDIEIISYRFGFDSTTITRQNFPEADAEAICRGVKDAFEKQFQPKYSDEAFNAALSRIRKNKISVEATKRIQEMLKNESLSKKFIKEKSGKKGVKKIAEGVYLEVLRNGNGEKVTENDIIEIHYSGWDASGKLFDSSKNRKRTSKFSPNDLVKGLKIGVLEMKKGGLYNVYVTPELGYGEKGFKERIEAGMALHFEVEIVNITRNKTKDAEKMENNFTPMDGGKNIEKKE